MRFLYSFTTNLATSSKRTAILVLCLVLVASSAHADVCVWRDPERTMQKIFPSARDYKTVTVKMTPEKINAIEKAIGTKLDDSEKNEFSFYQVTGMLAGGKPGVLGTIIALAGKGEYGVIEVVIGVNEDGKIVGAYIQRSRERTTHDLESVNFLNQFKGKTEASGFDVGKDIEPASASAERGSQVVTFVIRKMLAFYDVLQRSKS